MAVEKVDTIIVGAGQAGVAMSEHLTKCGVPHVVLERGRIAERWRSERWDSLVANGPAWHDRFPSLEFPNTHPDAFPAKEIVADYFVSYAQMFDAPIRCGVEVKQVKKISGRSEFSVETSQGDFEAVNVVAATGPFQTPIVPALIPPHENLIQLHSSLYRNPAQLPAGAVLVVGSGSSGVQIADELLRSGKRVFLSVGPHDRPPRSYRGRDFCWWLGVLNKWDAETRGPGQEHVTIAVSGARGGETIDFRRLAARGMLLVGRAQAFEAGKIAFADDLLKNVRRGDENYLSLLHEADDYIARHGINLPEEPEAHRIAEDPDCLVRPLLSIDLSAERVTSVIWATGFTTDYSWLCVDAFDEHGRPKHSRGISEVPGIYFLGLPWQSRRGSSFIWGVWHDAKHVADRIATRRKYIEYHAAAQRESEQA